MTLNPWSPEQARAVTDAAVRSGQALLDVLEERVRQDEKWGQQDHQPAIWLLILGKEAGEAAEEVLGDAGRERLPAGLSEAAEAIWMTLAEAGRTGRDCKRILDRGIRRPTMPEIPPERLAALRQEAVQTAAVALAFVECLDRGLWQQQKEAP